MATGWVVGRGGLFLDAGLICSGSALRLGGVCSSSGRSGLRGHLHRRDLPPRQQALSLSSGARRSATFVSLRLRAGCCWAPPVIILNSIMLARHPSHVAPRSSSHSSSHRLTVSSSPRLIVSSSHRLLSCTSTCTRVVFASGLQVRSFSWAASAVLLGVVSSSHRLIIVSLSHGLIVSPSHRVIVSPCPSLPLFPCGKSWRQMHATSPQGKSSTEGARLPTGASKKGATSLPITSVESDTGI